MDKSAVTNAVSASLIAAGYASGSELVRSIGLFATSGAITNWLAVHMLFERVPLLYGSGVIPARFEEFKAGIEKLIMEQFFTRDNVARFLSGSNHGIDSSALADAVDYDRAFARLVEAVAASPLGGMLQMFGGERALEPVRDPFKSRMRRTVVELAESEAFREALGSAATSDAIVERVGEIVRARLDELTPAMVKQIVQDMIREHLGWLVVWGGVFGGLMGLVAAFL